MFDSKGFNEITEDTLSYLLQSDKLSMEEADILEKVKEWANISSVSQSYIKLYVVQFSQSI